MTPEDHIIFVAELLNLINELQELVREHCQILTAERDGGMLENISDHKNWAPRRFEWNSG